MTLQNCFGHGSHADDSRTRPSGNNWAFIAVMGVTGAGKSTFIQEATGQDVVVGHGLESCTSDIKAYQMHVNGTTVNLIDTPGFNDTHRSETDVLKDIATWLADSYEKQVRLHGIIYIHSINNVRMEGSSLRNLKMFRTLCGDDPLKNVLLITSFWGKVDPETAERREEELRTTPEFWGQMLRKGSRIERFTDQRSAHRIVSTILEKDPVTLRIQQELVDEDKALIETAAGRTVNEELARLEAKHRTEKEQLQRELHEALKQRDEELEEILRDQQQRLDREIDKVQRQQVQLKADRRAERRMVENDIHLLNLKVEQMLVEVRQMSFDEAVAKARANEGILRPEDRSIVEQKIKEASREPELANQGSKRKGTAKYLLKALQVVFPVASAVLFGIPIPFPFSSSGGNESTSAESA